MSSTPEERIRALEVRMDAQEIWLRSIDEKLDKVVDAMNMGRGAWLALAKLGGFLVLLAGAGAWLADWLPTMIRAIAHRAGTI